MKIKSLLVVVGLLTWTSCANQAEGFIVSKFYPLGEQCDVSASADDFFTANGYLDVAAGAPQFFIGVRLSGAQNIQQNEVAVGSSVLERENRNKPIILQQVINYRMSKRVGTAPKPFLTNMTLPFSDMGVILMNTQLISDDLALQLEGLNPSPAPAPSNEIEDFVDILVDVEFKGEMSADKHPFTTGVLTYPIRAYRSLPVDCGMAGFTRRRETSPGTFDSCIYVGQTLGQLSKPPPPTCCNPMSGGC